MLNQTKYKYVDNVYTKLMNFVCESLISSDLIIY